MMKQLSRLSMHRQKYLKPRKADEIAVSLGTLSERWLKKDDIFRKRAADDLVRLSRFSALMAQAMLDSIFGELTKPKLRMLLKSELSDPKVLDGFRLDPLTGIMRYAEGPEIITHIFSSNLPNPAITSLVHGMLIKSAGIIKVSRRDAGIVPVFLESLKKHDRILYDANLLLGAGDSKSLKAGLNASDLVVAYGNDQTIANLKKTAGIGKKFAGYGHRISFSLYLKESLGVNSAAALAKKTAYDVWMADQRGCLSPSAVYVQKGGAVTPSVFAAMVAEALKTLSLKDAGKKRFDSERILGKEKFKNRWKLQKVAGKNTQFYESDAPGAWAVFYDEESGDLPITCGGQTVFVRSFKNLPTVYDALRPFKNHLQAAAVEAAESQRSKIAQVLAGLGLNRIARAGALQRPPVCWHHDGRPNFSDWLRWTDLE